MLFKGLHASAALHLEEYADVDHFRESEKYARAESIPLRANDSPIMRATLALPSCTLSLVHTFPRIVNGYDLSGRLLIVIPMNDITSTRINGEGVGKSLILLKGGPCTVVEPESRLVAILSVSREIVDSRWGSLHAHELFDLPPRELAQVRIFVQQALEFAADQPDALMAAGILEKLQATLLVRLERLFIASARQRKSGQTARDRHMQIVRKIDELINLKPLETANERLADEIGISVRTLQNASQSICGLPTYEYSRLRRLWSIRRQLRTGAPGLTIKASALAHGFFHMGEFSQVYRSTFGELPSATLSHARS